MVKRPSHWRPHGGVLPLERGLSDNPARPDPWSVPKPAPNGEAEQINNKNWSDNPAMIDPWGPSIVIAVESAVENLRSKSDNPARFDLWGN